MHKQFALGVVMWAAIQVNAQELGRAGSNEAMLRALENSWGQAVMAKDMKALEMLLGADLVFVDYDGKLMDRQQYMASIKAAPRAASQVTNELMTVHSYGTVAVVNGLYHERGTRNGKAYVLHERFTDTWVLRHGNWVCVASHSTLAAP